MSAGIIAGAHFVTPTDTSYEFLNRGTNLQMLCSKGPHLSLNNLQQVPLKLNKLTFLQTK